MYDKISDEDLQQLFFKGIFRYAGKPVQVVSTERKGKLILRPLNGDELFAANVTDKEFNTSPVPLGMCNAGGGAFYLSRIPARIMSVGLTERNLNIVTLNLGIRNHPKVHQKLARLVCEEVANCILGKYPSLDEAYEKLQEEDVEVVAFTRQFAIDKDHLLHFKGRQVGVMEKGRNFPVFFHSKNYLKTLWD